MKNPIIRVIGDSHVRSFWQHPFCHLYYHLGPVTAHNLINVNSDTNGRTKLFALAEEYIDDPLLLVFGEIDCRVHFCRIIEKEKAVPQEVVLRTIQNYLSVVNELREKGNKIILHSGIPASEKSSHFYGKKARRIYISRLFYKLLIESCRQEKILFIDIFKELEDSFGLMKKEFSIDGVHMIPNREMFEIITKQFLLILKKI